MVEPSTEASRPTRMLVQESNSSGASAAGRTRLRSRQERQGQDGQPQDQEKTGISIFSSRVSSRPVYSTPSCDGRSIGPGIARPLQ